MSLRSDERTIGTRRFRVHQLGFKQGRALLVRISKALGPALGAALEGVGGGAKVRSLRELLDADASSLASALGGGVRRLVEQVTDEDLDHITTVLAQNTEVELDVGRWVRLVDVLETEFGGAYETWLAWLGFALEVNYGGFFGALKQSLASAFGARGLGEPTRSASPSPSTSTGRSTGSPAQVATETA